jgi:hypothetical protein
MHDVRLRPWRTLALGALVTTFALGCATGPAPRTVVANRLVDRHATAAVLGDRLIWLSAEGQFEAWSLENAHPDRALAEQLRFGVPHMQTIAGDGTKLWGYSDEGVHQWVPEAFRWRLVAKLGAEDELLGFVANNRGPVLLYPQRVVDLDGGRTYAYPDLKGQVHGSTLIKVLDAKILDGHLWLGTGWGEWGGQLLGLDLRAGTWVQQVDDLHYPTGIEGSPDGNLLVAWSMSHMGADSVLRVHRPDGSLSDELPFGDGTYLQKVARLPSDGSTLVIEQRTLRRVQNLSDSEQLGDIGQVRYGLERNAVGVAPGIVQMFPAVPFAPDILVIVPLKEAPRLWKKGQLVVLERAPGLDQESASK